jgi:DnaJ like chaperone protein
MILGAFLFPFFIATITDVFEFSIVFFLTICVIFIGTLIIYILPKEWISKEEYDPYNYYVHINDKVLESITKLSYIIMKADEGITESELYTFRDYMLQNFGSGATADAINIMQYLQFKKNITTQEATAVINAKLNYAEKMQIMQYLFQLATSDGEMHEKELELLSQIADEMQISQTDFSYLKNAYNNMYNRRYYSSENRSSSASRGGSMAAAYAVLGVKSSDSNQEIKAAYRRLAVANHPDKVQHLGETAHSEAEKRFSQINEAYNKIKKERGI